MSCWLILTSNPVEELAGKSFMCTQSYAYGFTGFLAEHSLLPEPVTEFMTLRLKISCLSSALVLLDLAVNSSGSHILLSVEQSTIGTRLLVLCFFLEVMVGEKDLIFTFVWDYLELIVSPL